MIIIMLADWSALTFEFHNSLAELVHFLNIPEDDFLVSLE